MFIILILIALLVVEAPFHRTKSVYPFKICTFKSCFILHSSCFIVYIFY